MVILRYVQPSQAQLPQTEVQSQQAPNSSDKLQNFGYNQQQPNQEFEFNQALLLQMLKIDSITPEIQELLKKADVQAALNQIKEGIQNCRKAGLKIYESIPGIDQMKVRNIPPEQKYKKQLEQLEEMNFIDKQQNINALTFSKGNLDLAIDYILSH